MPIEFRCPGCDRLLRTPDESAGKNAKCPQCGAIVDVPPGPDADPEQLGRVPERFGRPSDNPFAIPDRPPAGEVNPYASPAIPKSTASWASLGSELTHRQVTFDEVLHSSWALFRRHLGAFTLLGVLLTAKDVLIQFLAQGVQAAANLANNFELVIVSTTIVTLVNMAIQLYIWMGSIRYVLKLVRTGTSEISELFSAGPYLLRGIGLYFWISLYCAAIALPCVAPAFIAYQTSATQEIVVVLGFLGAVPAGIASVVIWFRYFLSYPLIVDRGATIDESMRESVRFMAGNKVTALLLMIVVIFLGTVFFICTFCLGYIFYISYYTLVPVVVYLAATGQLQAAEGEA